MDDEENSNSSVPTFSNKKGGTKWKTLTHNGILFPPPYEPLPSKAVVLYDKVPIKLDGKNSDNIFGVTAEEAAGFYAMNLERDIRLSETSKDRKNIIDSVFTQNFFTDWKKILGSGHTIKDIKKVDFMPLVNFLKKKSEEKKADKKKLTKEEKKEEKEQKEEVKDKYGYAKIDGLKIPIGSYVVQPPGLYVGHGNQPMRGKIKKRLEPSDVTLNITKEKAPKCENHGKPCKWGKIIEDREVTWIASWRHPLTKELTYIWLKRDESHFVVASDQAKFEKARELGENIEKVREKYKADLSSKNKERRQLATAVYLLDILAVRPGTEKDEKTESDTLGLTTLKCGNINFLEDGKLKIDFVGKSSIQFVKKFRVENAVYNNLRQLCEEGSRKSKHIFPDVNSTSLNDYLKTLLPGLTAKVFRTYKAGYTLQKQLDENSPSMDALTHEKKIYYDTANVKVALALNHKNLTKNSARIDKLGEKVIELKQKLKDAKTDKQKESARKTLELTEAKIEQAGENISLGTSKQNYIDPRISVAWCKKVGMPIEKLYSKSQLGKFKWAMEAKSDWKF